MAESSHDRQEVYRGIIEQLMAVPVSQATDEVRTKAIEIYNEEPSEVEAYDFLVWVSNRPCPEEISEFVHALCSVSKYYPDPSPPNMEILKDLRLLVRKLTALLNTPKPRDPEWLHEVDIVRAAISGFDIKAI